MNDAPILPPASPFPGNVHHSQIQHFQQAVIGREYGLGLGHLSKLSVKSLNRVGGVDQPPDLLGVLEVGAQVGPVFPPGAADLGIFLSQCSEKASRAAKADGSSTAA